MPPKKFGALFAVYLCPRRKITTNNVPKLGHEGRIAGVEIDASDNTTCAASQNKLVRLDVSEDQLRILQCLCDALTTLSGSVFQTEEAPAGKARLPTVESLTDGTIRRLVAAERRIRNSSYYDDQQSPTVRRGNGLTRSNLRGKTG